MSFVIKKDVPILDEHVLRDEDGEELVNIDEKRLLEIARRNNARVAQTGDLTPIVIGHTRDGEPEDEQPEIVGYASGFGVKPFGKTGRKALTATFKFFKDKVDKIRQFPRRSVELWLSDWKIDPIALLGATTPERDLGLLQLSRGGQKKIRRIMFSQNGQPAAPSPGNSGQDSQVAAIANAVVETLKQTDVWQFMEQQMATASAPEPPLPPGGMDLPPPELGMDDGAGLLPEEEDFPPEEEEEGDYEDEDAGEEDEPVRYQNSMPSGTNTYTPSYCKPKQMSRQAQNPRRVQLQRPTLPPELVERIRMAAAQRRAETTRYQKAFHQLASEHEQLRLKFQRADREKDLIQLEAEGYVLDRVEELDTVTDMDDAAYKRHLGTIRKRYQRAPVNVSLPGQSFRSPSPVQGRDKDRALQIAEYAAQKGITYADAISEMEGE